MHLLRSVAAQSPDTNFTVKKGTQRADPYGWRGEYGTDPLKVDGKDNVCLWETCQWY